MTILHYPWVVMGSRAGSGLCGVDARHILYTWTESRVCSNLITVDRLETWRAVRHSTKKRPHLPRVSRAERW